MNEEVGTAVELTPHVQLWGKVMIPAARNKEPPKQPTNVDYFNLIDHSFLFSTNAKLYIVKKHAENVTRINSTFWNLKAIWAYTSQGVPIPDVFTLKVRRSSLFDDMIFKLNSHEIEGGSYWRDPFKVKMKIAFDGEAGDDWGGVRKEFFSLLFKEAINRAHEEDLLEYNED